MIVAGVMSGTSADGINVAVVRMLGSGASLRFQLLAHSEYEYPAKIRAAILKTMNASAASVADISRLDFLLGELYSEAVRKTLAVHRIRGVDLIGCHGQTIYHQGESAEFLGKRIACTWQLGEGSILAARIGVPAVSDFRPADIAAGGKGAPLVPLLDYVIYRHGSRGRILQNIGGIGNLTAIPARGTLDQVIAFDTGPGNMVIDAATQELFGRRFDKNGTIAARGTPLEKVISHLLQEPYFRQKPPKTAGREEFGREFTERFLRKCGSARKEDIIATATELTVRSIVLSVKQFVLSDKSAKYRDYVVAGGGVNNRTLMNSLREQLQPLGLEMRSSDDVGIPPSAKEAIAFALLAYQTWQRKPGNVPSATGAARAVILGKISYA
jgi:anhydro-N-acetylmuramic acid kinase